MTPKGTSFAKFLNDLLTASGGWHFELPPLAYNMMPWCYLHPRQWKQIQANLGRWN